MKNLSRVSLVWISAFCSLFTSVAQAGPRAEVIRRYLGENAFSGPKVPERMSLQLRLAALSMAEGEVERGMRFLRDAAQLGSPLAAEILKDLGDQTSTLSSAAIKSYVEQKQFQCRKEILAAFARSRNFSSEELLSFADQLLRAEYDPFCDLRSLLQSKEEGGLARNEKAKKMATLIRTYKALTNLDPEDTVSHEKLSDYIKLARTETHPEFLFLFASYMSSYDQAEITLEFLNKLIESDSVSRSRYWYLGKNFIADFYFDNGRPEDSEKVLLSLLADEKNLENLGMLDVLATAYDTLGRIRFEEDRISEAVQHARDAVNKANQVIKMGNLQASSAARIMKQNLANYLIASDQLDEAALILESIGESIPLTDRIELEWNRFIIDARNKNFQGAKQKVERWHSSGQIKDLINLGRYYIEIRDLPEYAPTVLGKISDTDLRRFAHFGLAELLDRAGMTREGLLVMSELKQALRFSALPDYELYLKLLKNSLLGAQSSDDPNLQSHYRSTIERTEEEIVRFMVNALDKMDFSKFKYRDMTKNLIRRAAKKLGRLGYFAEVRRQEEERDNSSSPVNRRTQKQVSPSETPSEPKIYTAPVPKTENLRSQVLREHASRPARPSRAERAEKRGAFPDPAVFQEEDSPVLGSETRSDSPSEDLPEVHDGAAEEKLVKEGVPTASYEVLDRLILRALGQPDPLGDPSPREIAQLLIDLGAKLSSGGHYQLALDGFTQTFCSSESFKRYLPDQVTQHLLSNGIFPKNRFYELLQKNLLEQWLGNAEAASRS